MNIETVLVIAVVLPMKSTHNCKHVYAKRGEDITSTA